MEPTKLVYTIKPYGNKQTLLVFDKGKKVDEYQFFLKDFDKVLDTYIAKYQNVRVDFIGPKQFLTSFVKKYQTQYTNIDFVLV